jgi:hypothetical protein
MVLAYATNNPQKPRLGIPSRRDPAHHSLLPSLKCWMELNEG